eukprot:TRINITY_DN69125_c0_g1_i1.p1 TRINITY_DN69125_c0_g1~~TRINITY_DN69125_c0_g1_i1.p1  ORF type:complete len:461 (-),score=76.62 TRINITY_DN69125_c0_g1_i1:65-1447(-)
MGLTVGPLIGRLFRSFMPWRGPRRSGPTALDRWRRRRSQRKSGGAIDSHAAFQKEMPTRARVAEERPFLGEAAGEEAVDRELKAPARAVIAREATHCMMFPEDTDASGSDSQIESFFGGTDLDTALQARNEALSREQIDQEQKLIHNAVVKICKARSTEAMFELMDSLILDDWLGGVDQLPGNVYAVLSFAPLPLKWTPRSITKYMGFLLIFLIQLLGPPLLFYQARTGQSIPGHEQVHWDKWILPKMTDWWENGKYADAFSTKLTALFFVFCFCLNGIFCHMDNAQGWLKIDRIFKNVNYNGVMPGTSELMLKLGALINAWVIVWLCVDVYIVLGTSATITDVLLDALAISFVYNLDDIGGDLGFVDQDDWPGVRLAWLDKVIGEVAERDSDIEEIEASRTCLCFLTFITLVLIVICFVVPFLFIITPFGEMVPDPYFEEMLTKDKFTALVNQVNRTDL